LIWLLSSSFFFVFLSPFGDPPYFSLTPPSNLPVFYYRYTKPFLTFTSFWSATYPQPRLQTFVSQYTNQYRDQDSNIP
jgi:hypothetical protein